ncbi:hypothetical protein [Francisella uliginis]|uniref:hypothetical protein n=1 Tax=Francisella uliginis TaxID=573570 RepID=UPI0011AB8752|nr:hypothetical protein [Francisella uliginis]
MISHFHTSLIDITGSIIVSLIAFFFITDLIYHVEKYICNNKSLKKEYYGCEIILGDWGSGKTYYFDKEYIKEHIPEYTGEIEPLRLSCFSYSREEFITKLVNFSFINRWISLNGLLSGYILSNWEDKLPENKLIFIDDLERFPSNENLVGDFIGIIEKLKQKNRVVIACNITNIKIKQQTISEYLEKLVDYNPIEITLEKQILLGSIISVLNNTIVKYISSDRSEIKEKVQLLINKLESNKDSLIRFIGLFSDEIKGNPINLRNLTKILSNIYKQENSCEIIDLITTHIEITKDITEIYDIKSCYKYLKLKDQFKNYLDSHEILFKYPNIQHIMKDFELFKRKYNEENKDEDIELLEALKQADKFDSGMYLNGAFKAYISKKVDNKYINQFVRLNDNILIQKISFSYIDNLLNQINTYSKITKKELLQGVFDTSTKEKMDDYFFVKNEEQKGTISLCKAVSFYNLVKVVSSNSHQEFYFNKIAIMVLEYSKHIAKYLEYQRTFWTNVSNYFSDNDLICLCQELTNLMSQNNNKEYAALKILRILSFAHFSEKHNVIKHINDINEISLVTNIIKKYINDDNFYHEIYSQELLLDLHYEIKKVDDLKIFLEKNNNVLDISLSKTNQIYKNLITKLESIFNIPPDFI